MIVGLDTKWKKLPDGTFTTALLQLCVGIRVLVFQVLYGADGDLPAVLKSFLIEEDHIFTGAHIENDVKWLQVDFGITISSLVDLQIVVPEAALRYKHLGSPHEKYGKRHSSLEKIASEVLFLPRLQKPDANHDNWDAWHLQPS